MITLFTAIAPEAKALLTKLPMKKINLGTLSLYESEDKELRLLITGSGKLSAAMAVTEYLTAASVSDTDIFCNFGICGSVGGPAVGEGFLCAALTELSTGKATYPELYTHPFREARLLTADSPVTENSFPKEDGLPLLCDMEGYGIGAALFRLVSPSRCFFYKVVSDLCDGQYPSPEEVTALLQNHLGPLLSFLKDTERKWRLYGEVRETKAAAVASFVQRIIGDLPFSATMERRLTGLVTYALAVGFTEEELLCNLPERTDTPHKKREALALLQAMENTVKTPRSCHKTKALSLAEKKLLRPFRHIYAEREVLSHPTTKRLLARFSGSSVIPIDHYKDVFNRSRQDLHTQETEPSLILAANHGTLFYPGAPVCQSFGEEHFMYTSCIMNCVYDCDYCYLQGMYPGGNLVVFVNLTDYFKELDSLLAQHSVYLCCSYDSDLTALSGLLPHAEEFCRYALNHPNLRLELRTKSAALPFMKQLPAAKNIVMAFTLSPQELIDRYEHYTPSLKARLATAKEAANRGFSLRLCFDPILDVPNAEELYTDLVDKVFEILTPEEIADISLGVFRLSKDYLKQLKKAKPACALSHYPYEQTQGVCHYNKNRCDALLERVCTALTNHSLSRDKLFIWAPEESMEGEAYVEE